MKKFLLSLVFLFLFTSCNNPSKDAEFLPVEKAEVKEVDVTGMVGNFSYVSNGLLQVKNPNGNGYDFISSDGKLLRGDYPFIKHGDYVGLGRFFVRENEESGYIIDSKGKVIVDNFIGRPILQTNYFRNGLLGVMVKRELGDTVLDIREIGVKAKGDSPNLYNDLKDPNRNGDDDYAWGMIDVDGNVYKDGDPSILGSLMERNGYHLNYSQDKTDVILYMKSIRDNLFGLYDLNEDKPITEPFFSGYLMNRSSEEKSGTLVVITKDFDLLWIDTQGNTILDFKKIFPETKEGVRKIFTSEDEKGILSFVSDDVFMLKFYEDDKAVFIGKDGKALGYLDAEKILFLPQVSGKYIAYKNHEGKWGVLRDDLKVVVEPSYDDITSIDKNYFVGVRGEKTFLCTIVE